MDIYSVVNVVLGSVISLAFGVGGYWFKNLTSEIKELHLIVGQLKTGVAVLNVTLESVEKRLERLED